MDSERYIQLRERLFAVTATIEQACRAAGRPAGAVQLVAVTKNHPADDAAALVTLGQTQLGENRVQEAVAKAADLHERGLSPTWHFIGQLQRNKVRKVADFATWVHSVDRQSIAEALDRVAGERSASTKGGSLSVSIQVNLDAQDGRGGVPIADVKTLAEYIAGLDNLRLRGVMAVAPPTWEPARAFALLQEISASVQSIDPAAVEISAGMSGDFVTAIEHGATLVRVGSNILGRRL